MQAIPFVVAGALCIAATSAQTPAPRAAAPQAPTAQAPAPDYCSLTSLIGAKVEATQAPADRSLQPAPDTSRTGKVADLLVARHSGEIVYAVLAFEEPEQKLRTLAVPAAMLAWSGEHDRFDVQFADKRLEELPSFDVDAACKSDLDQACELLRQYWEPRAGDAVDAGHQRAEPAPAERRQEARSLAGTEYFLLPPGFVCATQIDDLPVHDAVAKFGDVADLIVDRDARRVELVVLRHGATLGIGGTDHLVPWRVLRHCIAGDQRLYCIPRTAAELREATVYEKPERGAVDAAVAARVLSNRTFDGPDDRASGDRAPSPPEKR